MENSTVGRDFDWNQTGKIIMKFQDNIHQRLTGRHKKSFSFVGDVREKIILDIGCSYGWFEKWAIENSCRRVVGIEPKESYLKSAKDTIQGAVFKEGTALNIPFENNNFDIVVMWEVLEHLPKNTENESFLEISRILKLGSSLFLSIPNRTFWSCVLDPAWWLIGHRHYSIRELEEKLTDTGFKITKIEYSGGFYELFSMILLYIFKWVFRKEIPFKEWFDKNRDREFLDGRGFTNIFIEARKNCD